MRRSIVITVSSNQPDLWREPFLLAVAYQSREPLANDILHELMQRAGRSAIEQQVQLTLLAATAITEAEPLTLDPNVEKQASELLLDSYEQAQREREFDLCRNIEGVMQRWLLSLPGNAYRLELLEAIVQTITIVQHPERQRATLTLLAMIAARLESCAAIVFDKLLPPLLALTGLLSVGSYTSTRNISISDDLDVLDLALTTLSFLGTRGPASLYLTAVQQDMAHHPKHVEMLAHCSLECGTLITPVVVPLTEANYQRYATAIQGWIELRDRTKGQSTPQAVDVCKTIQQEILACAEEIRYPASLHILTMLERTQSGLSWTKVWQDYLVEQLNTGTWIAYQECVLLWNALFLVQQLHPLVDVIKKHYQSASIQKHYAQRFIVALSYDLRDLRGLSDLRELRHLRYLRELRDLRYLRYLKDARYLSELRNLRVMVYLRELRDLIGLKDLREFLLIKDIAEKSLFDLKIATSQQKIDLLAILMGRMLQVREDQGQRQGAEDEVRRLALAALEEVTLGSNEREVREAALEVLFYLPARSVGEITLVRQLAEDNAGNGEVQEACAYAIGRARPGDEQAWDELARLAGSASEKVREAALVRLKNRQGPMTG